MIFEKMVLTDRISETVEDQIQLQLAQFGDRLYKVCKIDAKMRQKKENLKV